MQNSGDDMQLAGARKPITIAGIIMLMAAMVPVNGWYINWHDERYARRNEVLLLAQAKPIKDQLEQTQQTAEDTAEKVEEIGEEVESVKVSTAILLLSSLKADLDRHERNPEANTSWQRERDTLRRQIEQCERYVTCLQNSQRNCDALRWW